jgi:small subunit ribosomal protein S16
MLVIRLRRIGRKHDPHYRLVVTEHTAPVQGKFLAEVGHYHPKSKELEISNESFMSWIEKGAKPSNTVSKLALKAGLTHKHIAVVERHAKPKNAPEATVTPEATTAIESDVNDAPADEATEISPESVEVTDESAPSESEEVTEAATESAVTEPTEENEAV